MQKTKDGTSSCLDSQWQKLRTDDVAQYFLGWGNHTLEKEGREFALHTAMEFMYYSDFGYCGTQYPSDCIPNDAKYSATSGCGMNTQTRIWRHRYIHRYKYGHTDTYVDTHQTHTFHRHTHINSQIGKRKLNSLLIPLQTITSHHKPISKKIRCREEFHALQKSVNIRLL